MCQVHKDMLRMILASLGLALIGVGLELMLVGPSQLSVFILSIHPPLYLVGGAIAMIIPACWAMFMAYSGLREEHAPFTKQLATATLKMNAPT